MKKVILLFICILLVTGCTVTKVGNNSIDEVIEFSLNKEISLANTYFKGYKFYVPRGVKILDKNEYNTKLSYKNNNIYVFVDAISYYHKIEVEISKKEDSYFSKEIDYNGKKGYIEINKVDDKYFLGIYYNYSKIEAYIKEEDLEDSIMQIGTILSSIKFNDNALETLVGENVLDYKEESFNLFDTKKNSNFLEYIDEYDNYDESNNKKADEDTIDTELND